METNQTKTSHPSDGDTKTASTMLADLLHECAVPLAILIDTAASQRRSDMRWSYFKRIAIVGLALVVLFAQMSTWRTLGVLGTPKLGNGVAVISVFGDIGPGQTASADRLVPLIEEACAANNTSHLLLRISSPGGSPSDAQRIGAALDRCGKPTAAVIERMGASAAYLIAVHTDKIAADPYAFVGSVGAILKKVSAEGVLEKVGVRETVFASGELKGGGTMLTDPTPAQAQLTQALVQAAGDQFVAVVKTRRKAQLDAGVDLASGRMWLAGDAKTAGLIDEVMVVEEAVDAWYGADVTLHQYAPRRTLMDELNVASVADILISRLMSREPERTLE